MRRSISMLGLAIALLLVAPPAAAAGTKLKIGSMTVNGLTVKEVRCTLDRSGFLVAMTVVGTLAKQKKAFDRCAKRGAAFAVSFTWSGSKTRKAQISFTSRKKARKCILRALKRLRPALNGTCSMVLLTGERKAAERAAAKVLAAMKKARQKARPKKKSGRR